MPMLVKTGLPAMPHWNGTPAGVMSVQSQCTFRVADKHTASPGQQGTAGAESGNSTPHNTTTCSDQMLL
jgi:hypothetical protein